MKKCATIGKRFESLNSIITMWKKIRHNFHSEREMCVEKMPFYKINNISYYACGQFYKRQNSSHARPFF